MFKNASLKLVYINCGKELGNINGENDTIDQTWSLGPLIFIKLSLQLIFSELELISDQTRFHFFHF